MVKEMIQVSISRVASSCAIFNFRLKDEKWWACQTWRGTLRGRFCEAAWRWIKFKRYFLNIFKSDLPTWRWRKQQRKSAIRPEEDLWPALAIPQLIFGIWIAKILKNNESVSVDPVQNAPLDRFWGALRDSYVDFFLSNKLAFLFNPSALRNQYIGLPKKG